MTEFNINTATKALLTERVQYLAQENATLKATAQNAVNLANYFAFNLESIEKFILNSPIGKGKFFKTFFFILSNWKAITQLLEDIINQVQEWRDKVNELKEQAKNNSGDVPTTPGAVQG